MKNISFFKYSLLFFMAISLIGFNACSDDDDDVDPDDPPVFVEDGMYITGDGTALPELAFEGLMLSTRNEVTQEDRPELLELYIAIQGGSAGFNIVEVSGADRITYGPGEDFAVVTEEDRDQEEPQLDFWRGSFVETDTPFTVPEDGLYHVAIDTELGVVIVVPVAYWGLIGAATPGGWGGDTEMTHMGFDLNTMTFRIVDVAMTAADFKFRYSGGWKVIIDDDAEVRINANYGGSVDELVPGGANISNPESGLYTIDMVWTLGEPYAASMERTGDLDAFDYTDTELGLIGESLIVDGEPHNWDETIMVHTPEVLSDTEFLWTFEGVEVAAGEPGFKIREGQTWDGFSFGYPQVVMAGLLADNFETNDDGNFVAIEGGIIDIEFKIDALADVRTFTVNPSGAAPELFILGDGTPAGWDNTAAIPMEGTDGEYTITLELPGEGMIKFIEILGEWAPQYGTDEDGTSEGGNLVYRPDEDTPDPDAIPAPEEGGTYIITANTNDMIYTIAPAK